MFVDVLIGKAGPGSELVVCYGSGPGSCGWAEAGGVEPVDEVGQRPSVEGVVGGMGRGLLEWKSP